jgi:hypothetical protein
VATLVTTLLFISLTPYSYQQAPTPAIISDFIIRDPNGNDVTGKPLVAGGTYTFSFSVSIGTTLNDQILMSTSLEKIGDRYWTLENNYQGVDTNTWQPGGSRVAFRAIQGTPKFTLSGKVNSNITTDTLKDGKVIHFPVKILVLSIALQSTQNVLDQRILNVTDQAMIQYQNTLSSKQNLLSSSQTIPQYVTLAQGIIEQAEGLARVGYVEDATKILSMIPSSGLPSAPGVESTFLYIAIGIAVVTVLLAVMFLRANSSKSIIARQADDKAKKLDVLLVKASRIDKSLATEIETVKKELEELARR